MWNASYRYTSNNIKLDVFFTDKGAEPIYDNVPLLRMIHEQTIVNVYW